MGTALSHHPANGAHAPLPTAEVDRARRIRALERTVGELRERIRELEATFTPEFTPPPEWKLARKEAWVFGVLLNRDVATKDQLLFVLRNNDEDELYESAVHMHVSKTKRKLRPFGVVITSKRYEGYRLEDRLNWKARLG